MSQKSKLAAKGWPFCLDVKEKCTSEHRTERAQKQQQKKVHVKDDKSDVMCSSNHTEAKKKPVTAKKKTTKRKIMKNANDRGKNENKNDGEIVYARTQTQSRISTTEVRKKKKSEICCR